jgi:hypothetical protein
MAKEIGAFEKYGIRADLIFISSGPVVVQACLAGTCRRSWRPPVGAGRVYREALQAALKRLDARDTPFVVGTRE